MAEHIYTMLTGAMMGALGAVVILMFVGFARGARKAVGERVIVVPVTRLIGQGGGTFAAHPRMAVRLILLGAAGSVGADLVAYATGSLFALANLIWFFVNAVIVYFWHRAVLTEDAQRAGLPTETGGLVAVMARLFIFGMAVSLPAVVLTLAMLTTASLLQDMPALALLPAMAAGVGFTLLTIWMSRASLSFPATAVRQPDAGLRRMFSRAKGLGRVLAAALWTIGLVYVIALGIVTVAGDAVWLLLDPAGYDAMLQSDPFGGLAASMISPAMILTQSIPMGVVVSVYTLWSISCLSVAYREWILPEYAAAPSEPPASEPPALAYE